MKLVFFDFWGTLVENGIHPSPVRQVKYILGLGNMHFPEYIVRFEKVFMTKKFDDLYEAFGAVCDEFDIRKDKAILDKLVGMWNKNRLLAKPYPETEKVLGDIKVPKVLISNTDCFSLSSVMEKYELDKYFDFKILSCDEGMLKTNPKMFNLGLEKFSCDPKEALMIGDSVPSDMRGAENAGIKGVLIDRNKRRDYEPKIVSLDEVNNYLG